ncbi:MAG: hypothetical protein A2745_00400 [Candidatus Harrisonbacteria bacterium RIFCSPHIGHO2_01_FULL_44_13]|uniref:Uncharacterized protein n=1 Tax=Candidatus Harrisonbacteria bacterium RIFCSPLOWO2_01_FULL_44_18 TaxID=1798407 RepID=A0A1G1ZQW2_9BACT|nr:MAG: hypothetical protein A2745_00400 [Candidatus Harrisonbacteria bacterium RIFCSPHIGHO2_01_FULL_44_13]OGY66140.1 MAG: hypothetical protein A3A16_02420 [Candidatus Harrisonbacteria bacterium RIFCSPLOWO2_01_FULL_44_18]
MAFSKSCLDFITDARNYPQASSRLLIYNKLMDQVAPKSKPKLSLIAGVIVVAVLGLAVAGYLLLKKSAKTSEEKAVETLEGALKSATSGTLPEITPLTNPLEKLPEINPVEKANPFKGLQTNPFE